jgi:hypothetical protein
MTEDSPLYIDPFRDVTRKEKEYRDTMARNYRYFYNRIVISQEENNLFLWIVVCWIRISCDWIVLFFWCFEMLFSYRSEFQFLMGQFPEAKLSYTQYYQYAEPHTAPYLDFVFTKDFSSLHPLTRLNVSVLHPPFNLSAFVVLFVLILSLRW